MRAVLLALTAIGIFIAVTNSAQASRVCTQTEAIQAEGAIDTLHSWARVYEVYSGYQQCDDGAIAEGFSDGVATLLTRRWDSIGELLKLSSEHPRFKRFVIGHIDETMDEKQPKMILENVRHRCPYGARDFCAEIEKQVKSLDFKSAH
jgi:hypothetical protein